MLLTPPYFTVSLKADIKARVPEMFCAFDRKHAWGFLAVLGLAQKYRDLFPVVIELAGLQLVADTF